MIAPIQTETRKWKDIRVGRFTASTFGALLTEPRSKAAREAGEFSATARALITAKAIERLTGVWMNDVDTPLMRRGLLMEPGAMYCLSKHWQPVDCCTFQPMGNNFGSTPDLLTRVPDPGDLKCPGNAADVVRFADEVHDDDFDSLLRWDKDYAWQTQCQALTCGSERCWLIYFTDRLPIIPLSDEDMEEIQTLTDARAEQYSQESRFPWSYSFAEQNDPYAPRGFFYAARWFSLTEERRDLILSTLERAEIECVNTMHRLRPILTPHLQKAA